MKVVFWFTWGVLCGVSAGLVGYEKDEENQALLLVVISTQGMGCDGESC